MLKITRKTEEVTTTLELEGRLAGAYVEELERCWRELAPGRNLKISLQAVTFIDDHGKRLLARLYESGAVLKASGCMTKCIVQEITGAN
jgi:anti-anti-sigma regulatory factor